MKIKALGIFREILHSPKREIDDSEILRWTGKQLSNNGVEVVLKKPEEFLHEYKSLSQTSPQIIFAMCEQEKILQILKHWKSRRTIIVNSPHSILNTYRYRMIPRLHASLIPLPQSELFTISAPFLKNLSKGGAVPSSNFLRNGTDGQPFFFKAFRFKQENYPAKKLWVKRGDVHNTQKGDVFLAETVEEIKDSFSAFRSRGIKQVLLQEHIDGDLIKFYGVSMLQSAPHGKGWFKWFYHKNQNLQRYTFSKIRLKKIAQTAAKHLGLEIYGGDAIVTSLGKIFLIDINAWPSFALFRQEASKIIGEQLLAKIKANVSIT